MKVRRFIVYEGSTEDVLQQLGKSMPDFLKRKGMGDCYMRVYTLPSFSWSWMCIKQIFKILTEKEVK